MPRGTERFIRKLRILQAASLADEQTVTQF